LLRDFASSPEAFKEFADTWPAAVAKLGTPAARELLLGFVDPELKGLPEMPLDRIDALVWRIAELAKNDPKTAARLRELCDKDLSAIKRELLAKVLSDVGTGEAVISSLNLIDDRSPRAIPRGTWEHIEAAFVQRRRRDGSENIFTLEASASNQVRAKLFDMMLRDERRRKSAFKILGQIEKWRLEYGRPTGEPRHPAFNSGVPCPSRP
jgi:NACHT conflict system protein